MTTKRRNSGLRSTRKAAKSTATAAVKSAKRALAGRSVSAPAAPPTPKKAPPPLESARRYEIIALVLQGGGALGSYQCGVYEGLHNAGIVPNWFSGISIGAINAAVLAGNAPEQRVERLRAFWQRICTPAVPFAEQMLDVQLKWLEHVPVAWRDKLLSMANSRGAMSALLFGQSGFFVPRLPPPYATVNDNPATTSFYSTAPLKKTLEEFVDFDRINAGDVRFSVGAVNVRTGNFAYFDNFGEHKTPIRVEHVMASGALPPGFAAVEIDGEYYWDGGVVSNTPLDHVLSNNGPQRADSLVFQVDLWRAQGLLPRNLMEVAERQKDIQYSSRTRFSTDVLARLHNLRTSLSALIKAMPQDKIAPQLLRDLQPWLDDHVYNIIHLIYKTRPFEEEYKDYAFAPSTMQEHWSAGLADMRNTLRRAEFFVPPTRDVGVVTHDVHR